MRNGLTPEQRLRLHALDAWIAQIFREVVQTTISPNKDDVTPEITDRKKDGANA